MTAASPGNSSLRRRLLQLLLVPLLVLFAVSGIASYVFALHYANAVYDDWLYDSVNSLALEVKRDASGTRLDLSESAQRVFEWDAADKTYFAVFGSRSGLIGGRADFPELPPQAHRLRLAKVYDARIDNRAVRAVVLVLPASADGETVTVEVAESTKKRQSLAREILLGTLLPQALLIAVAGLLIWLGVRRGLEPLLRIARRLQAQSHRQLQPLADADVPLEAQPLTHALNELLQRLQALLVSQRLFIADAAHQLRTPLTALKLNIEHAQAETTLEGVRPLLAQLRISAERAARLSNQLLSLARTEPEASEALSVERLDLCALARDIGAEWVPRALAKRIDLSFSADAAHVNVDGDPMLLREALNNLLDNALKYHPGGGAIVVSVATSPRPSVSIIDDGPGIPPELRAQVFTRFHRGDRSGNVEGSGLGLAIVQGIAQAHGGQVSLHEGIDGKGVGVRFELPLPASRVAAISARMSPGNRPT
ncbi:MAG: sensor histidine kinase [Nevskia sp.]|nr:sensor histidine kinase [Nevskia sp.]